MKDTISLQLDEQVYDAFILRLNGDEKSKDKWNCDKLGQWTSYASETLSQILTEAPFNLDSASKGHSDSNGRYEYLTIDVCAHKNTWAPLEIAIEIENYHQRIEYAAWKLFALDCRYRILFAYYYPASNGLCFAKCQQDIIAKIGPVLKENNKKRLYLICGNGNTVAKSTPWDSILSKCVLND